MESKLSVNRRVIRNNVAERLLKRGPPNTLRLVRETLDLTKPFNIHPKVLDLIMLLGWNSIARAIQCQVKRDRITIRIIKTIIKAIKITTRTRTTIPAALRKELHSKQKLLQDAPQIQIALHVRHAQQ